MSKNTAFPKLWDDLSLRPYLGEIRRRHGIVESLALPSMHDLPPLRIETLFVAPIGGSARLDSYCHFLSGGLALTAYAAFSSAGRLS